MRNRSQFRSFALHCVLMIAAGAALSALTPLCSASAHTLKTLHSFCAKANCGDGSQPYDGLVMDASGNLYGTTSAGGKYNHGLVYKLIPNPDTGNYKEYILHNFCARANCTDGDTPVAGLIMDVDGNLYGTTVAGGKFGAGIAFKLTHKANGWSLGVIHAFCGEALCTDGSLPSTHLAYASQTAGVPWDEFSPLFGTTSSGGASGKGVAYKLAADGPLWDYEVIHSFNAPDFNVSAYPGPLLVNSSGNLFGATQTGGKHGSGVVFKLAAGTWKETILHNFCAEQNCTDGGGGSGRPAMDAAGNLYGTAYDGGSSNNGGVVFNRTVGGTYSVVYSFCPFLGCADGAQPSLQGGLTMNSAGILFGTTQDGGAASGGVVFEIDPGGTQSVLYNFCSMNDCADGADPDTLLLVDSAGDLFGTTYSGGAHGTGGTVFELTP